MRSKIHTRTIVCDAYRSDDGLYDIEATLRDVKPISVEVPGKGLVNAGEPVHDLTLCITIDKNKQIRNAKVKVAQAPFASCAEIAAAYQRLVGVTIRPGFTRQVKELFRSTSGCTHLTELLPVMATVAYQIARDKQRESDGHRDAPGAYFYIDSCYSLKEDGANVKQYFPRLYKASDSRDGFPDEGGVPT